MYMLRERKGRERYRCGGQREFIIEKETYLNTIGEEYIFIRDREGITIGLEICNRKGRYSRWTGVGKADKFHYLGKASGSQKRLLSRTVFRSIGSIVGRKPMFMTSRATALIWRIMDCEIAHVLASVLNTPMVSAKRSRLGSGICPALTEQAASWTIELMVSEHMKNGVCFITGIRMDANDDISLAALTAFMAWE